MHWSGQQQIKHRYYKHFKNCKIVRLEASLNTDLIWGRTFDYDIGHIIKEATQLWLRDTVNSSYIITSSILVLAF